MLVSPSGLAHHPPMKFSKIQLTNAIRTVTIQHAHAMDHQPLVLDILVVSATLEKPSPHVEAVGNEHSEALAAKSTNGWLQYFATLYFCCLIRQTTRSEPTWGALMRRAARR